MQRFIQELTKGLWREIPPFRVMLGLCPVLAVTKNASNGLGMGIAVLFVLVLSNAIISSVRNFIPKKVRIACFITISATLVWPWNCSCRPMSTRYTCSWASSCRSSW